MDELQSQIPAEFKRLKLTAEQREKIQETIKTPTKKNREFTEELRELKTELQTTLLTRDVDSDKLNRLQTEIAEKELAKEKVRVDMILQLKEILTPEQLKLWQRIRAQRGKNVAPARTRNG